MIDNFDGEHRWLSNFETLHPITIEHIYQAMKTTDPMEQIEVLMAKTPTKAKRAGRKVTLRPDWDDIKIAIMEKCLEEKFDDPVLAHKLEATGDEELVEGNWWNDTFWGVCRGNGRNELGKLLMKLRLRNRQ